MKKAQQISKQPSARPFGAMFAGNAQPSQHEVQALIGYYNAGQIQQAESLALNLSNKYPRAPIVLNVLGSSQAGLGKFEAATNTFGKLVNADPYTAENHCNLGMALQQTGKLAEAAASYRKALSIKGNVADWHYNLGIVLGQLDQLDDAAQSYRKAVALQPGFFEAYGNLGNVVQRQGKLDEAVSCYRKALEIHPDAIGHFNLGTALRDQGKLDEAVASYQKALALNPQYIQAYINLGETLRDQGKMEEAIANYQQALKLDPNNAQASYNMALFFYEAGRLTEAIPHYAKSQLADWRERILYCLYKTEQYAEFKDKLQYLLKDRNTSPFLATLSAHYAANFGEEDHYNFCKNPLDFVYYNRIESLATVDSQLLKDLLNDIQNAEIAERKQARLHHGLQSAGNLFKRPEASFAALGALIKQEFIRYQQQFAGQDCELMKAFPKELEFSSSWYVKMRQGGHLNSHIHETGWLSGTVYLNLPKNKQDQKEGSIEFSTHGDQYPQKHNNFPSKTVTPEVGGIVLFPSSLFHRTIPFTSDEERICIAFDLKPAMA
ncbi:tetratricopeptide repeat protein [Methyloradius palustris]|uniref:Uncharacterized protein n=1 Tax=Methyloradius palustris TaxID=2778876 RepID=A0A8E4DI35_9PROT|nr:tetratricopeptide repeat protein [Methyloradius palustris]BCM26227.1 hypothetical protein ZMTM_24860 [Methyloradius palustris]